MPWMKSRYDVFRRKWVSCEGLPSANRPILRSIHSQGVLTSGTGRSDSQCHLLSNGWKTSTCPISRRSRLWPRRPGSGVWNRWPGKFSTAIRPRPTCSSGRALVVSRKGTHSVDEVLVGVRHIIAEWFSERADVRGRLRKILQRTGKLMCSRVETPSPPRTGCRHYRAGRRKTVTCSAGSHRTGNCGTADRDTADRDTADRDTGDVTPEAVTPETGRRRQ